MWDILRPFLIFIIAILLIVAALFWLQGRALPLPRF
jgi:hypothetical protein